MEINISSSVVEVLVHQQWTKRTIALRSSFDNLIYYFIISLFQKPEKIVQVVQSLHSSLHKRWESFNIQITVWIYDMYNNLVIQ